MRGFELMRQQIWMSTYGNRYVRPPKIEPLRPPYVDLEITTWAKDSHGLYDYEAEEKHFTSEKYQINRSCKIFRHLTTLKTLILYGDDIREAAQENMYIASITTTDSKTFRIQSADVSGVQPQSYLRQVDPDIFRNSFIVVKDFQKDAGVEGFPLEAGNYIKIGRMEYLVIEVMDSFGSKTLKQTSHLEINKGTHRAGQELLGSCKVCLCEQQTIQDPLINPCSCKGSCALIHAGCLRNWINSKVKRELNGIAITYNFSKFDCEICKALFPKMVELSDGSQLDMITFEKPARPYIVLESVTERHERREELKERNLHVICPDEKYPVKLGRGHQCEIRIADISVSRTHSEIRYEHGKFYLKDLKSKFGTLVKFREEVVLTDQFSIQNGRTCFDFLLSDESKTEKNLVEEEIANRPVFYTQAQLRARGELSEEEEDI